MLPYDNSTWYAADGASLLLALLTLLGTYVRAKNVASGTLSAATSTSMQASRRPSKKFAMNYTLVLPSLPADSASCASPPAYPNELYSSSSPP